jgi:hypothetical protein
VLVFDLLILGMLVVTAGDYGGAVFPTCCCSTRPTSSACSTSSRWTKCAPSTASPPSSPKP